MDEIAEVSGPHWGVGWEVGGVGMRDSDAVILFRCAILLAWRDGMGWDVGGFGKQDGQHEMFGQGHGMLIYVSSQSAKSVPSLPRPKSVRCGFRICNRRTGQPGSCDADICHLLYHSTTGWLPDGANSFAQLWVSNLIFLIHYSVTILDMMERSYAQV